MLEVGGTYLSSAMAGPWGRALFLKKSWMLLGSGMWYGRPREDSVGTGGDVSSSGAGGITADWRRGAHLGPGAATRCAAASWPLGSLAPPSSPADGRTGRSHDWHLPGLGGDFGSTYRTARLLRCLVVVLFFLTLNPFLKKQNLWARHHHGVPADSSLRSLSSPPFSSSSAWLQLEWRPKTPPPHLRHSVLCQTGPCRPADTRCHSAILAGGRPNKTSQVSISPFLSSKSMSANKTYIVFIAKPPPLQLLHRMTPPRLFLTPPPALLSLLHLRLLRLIPSIRLAVLAVGEPVCDFPLHRFTAPLLLLLFLPAG